MKCCVSILNLHVFKFKKNKPEISLNWINLESEGQLNQAIEDSKEKAVVLFKHSTRCGISSMALDRLNSNSDLPSSEADFYYLDLLRFRPISNIISEKLSIQHESPQIILMRNGEITYHDSHNGIQPRELLRQIR